MDKKIIDCKNGENCHERYTGTAKANNVTKFCQRVNYCRRYEPKITDTVSIPIETNKKHIRQIDKTFNVKASKVTTETYLVADVFLEDHLNPYINKAKRGYIWNVKTAPASTVFIKPVRLCKEDEMGYNGRGLADLTPLFTVECTLYFKQARMTQMIDAVAFLNFIASGEYTEVKPIRNRYKYPRGKSKSVWDTGKLQGFSIQGTTTGRIKPEVSNMIIDDPLKPSMDLAVDKYGELRMASPAETDDEFNDMLKKSLGAEHVPQGVTGDGLDASIDLQPVSEDGARIKHLEKDRKVLIDMLIEARQQVRTLGGVPK